MSFLLDERDENFSIIMYGNFETVIDNSKSYVRHSHPSYQFEIHKLNFQFELPDNKIETYENDFYLYDLNWGDLFLEVINAENNIEYLCNTTSLYISELFLAKQELQDYVQDLLHTHKAKNSELKMISNDELLEKTNLVHIYAQRAALSGVIQHLFDEDEEHERAFTTYISLLLDANPPKKIIPVDQIRRKLDKESLLRTLNVTIKYGEWGTETEYAFSNFADVVLFDLHEMIKQNIAIKRCENCGRYFIPSARSDEKYCDYIYKNGKTCKQFGYENRLNNNEILKEYRKIYKTQNARKQRNKKNIFDIDNRFNNWAEYAKVQLEKCENGEIELSDFKNNISLSHWLTSKEGAINGKY